MQGRHFIIKAAVVLLTLVLLAPIAATVAGVSVPVWTLPYVSVASGFFLAIVFWYLSDTAGRSGSARSQTDLLEEIKAMNRHSMVSLADRDGRVFHVNEKMLATTGYEPDDLLGHSDETLFHDDDRALRTTIGHALEHGQTWVGETRLRHRDGHTLWTQTTILPRMDRNGDIAGSTAIRTDITASKVAAEQEHLLATMHNLSDEIYMLDPDTLAFSYMNDAALARQGWETGAYRSRSLEQDCDWIDAKTFRARIEPLLGGAERHLSFHDVIDDVPFDIRLQLIRTDPDRKRLVMVMRDLSEQARIEGVKSELLATISHELRTPMTSIKGAMGLLLSNAAGELPEKARGMLSIAYRNADRLVMIINDILDIEKIAAGQMEFDMARAPLARVIDEAIAANEQFANRFDVAVEKGDIDPSAIALHDFDRTLQVLTNLLSNAAKFSPPGGRVKVDLTREGDRHRISIQDFGVGIPDEAQVRIFERFAQVAHGTSHGVAGTGLGLNIAKAIMEQQNGFIGVVSAEGEGSTFFIEFPDTNRSVGDEPNRVYALHRP